MQSQGRRPACVLPVARPLRHPQRVDGQHRLARGVDGGNAVPSVLAGGEPDGHRLCADGVQTDPRPGQRPAVPPEEGFDRRLQQFRVNTETTRVGAFVEAHLGLGVARVLLRHNGGRADDVVDRRRSVPNPAVRAIGVTRLRRDRDGASAVGAGRRHQHANRGQSRRREHERVVQGEFVDVVETDVVGRVQGEFDRHRRQQRLRFDGRRLVAVVDRRWHEPWIPVQESCPVKRVASSSSVTAAPSSG